MRTTLLALAAVCLASAAQAEIATYYGKEFAGRRTASGERFNPGAMTAAHRSLRFGTRVRVTNTRTGRSVIVRINDRGPFARGVAIDLSSGAARAIGMGGTGHVRLQVLG
jgi:rare lipoprotein A